jgi:hypothetical protein
VEALYLLNSSSLTVPVGGPDGENFRICNVPIDLAVSVQEPSSTNYLKFNGNVRTSDITAITRHILGTVTFPTGSYQYVAADALTDFNIDVGDIIAVRSGILGIDTNIMTSAWRYPTAGWLSTVGASSNLSTFEDSYDFSDVSGGASLDFVAVKSGDVINSTPNDPYDKSENLNFLKFSGTNIASTGLVEVPVWVDNVEDLRVMSFALSTVKESLEIVGVKPGTIRLVENKDYTISAENSLLKMIVVNIEDETYSGKEPAFYLQLRAKRANVRLSGNIQLSVDEIDNEFYPKVKREKSGPGVANIAIDWLPEIRLSTGQNDAKMLSANPLRNELNVQLSLIKTSTVTATLYDNTGRVMFRETARNLAGSSTLRLNHAVSDLPFGVYHLEVRTDTSVLQTFKLIK